MFFCFLLPILACLLYLNQPYHPTVSLAIEFNKTLTCLSYKNSLKLAIQGNFINLIKIIYKKADSKHPNGKLLEVSFAQRPEIRKPIIISLFNITLEDLAYTTNKKKKILKNWKGESKMVTIHREHKNPKESTNKY